MLTTADSGQKSSEYDQLLAEAVKMHQEHEIKAKYFIPKMYNALRKEGLSPFDAADRIYKDVVGIWQKDTIRRLLPVEAKDQAARERQVLSRRSMAAARGAAAGLILRDGPSSSLSSSSTTTIAAAATAEEDHHYSQEDIDPSVTKLEQENSQLKKEISDLENTKKSLLERALRLERSLTEHQRQQRDQSQQNNHQIRDGSAPKQDEVTILLPPNLFMKTYTLMRGSTKPLLLKVKAGEAVDVDKANLPR